MDQPLTLAFLFLFLGLLLGFGAGFLWMRVRLRGYLLPEEIETTYVSKAVFQSLRQQADTLEANLYEKAASEMQLSADLASERTHLEHLQRQLAEQLQRSQQMQRENQIAFENLANRLLEEKSQKFTQQNQSQLQHLLAPLQDKIKAFEDNIQRRHLEETRDRVSLKKEIEQLRQLNQQLSQDAGNLAAALKGDNKTQGDWGEMQLQLLLEKAGLQKDIHFRTQSSFRDQNGQLKRPDFIINLPANKHLVIDCKVSLTAYERYSSATDPVARKQALAEHLLSFRNHIKDLSKKKYQQLHQISTPDYVLLFVPIEPAFTVAVQKDQRLFLDALDRDIVLVTTSTLLATMRTVSYIWKQEKQQRSVQEIARQSGQLYDKFVNFVEDLQSVGLRLNSAQQAYNEAMYKLSEGKRRSQTLIGRAEKLRQLGARTSKRLPAELRMEEE